MELRWTRAAEADLYRIADDYGALDPDLADILLERIEDSPLILLERPRIGAPTGWQGMRKWPVRKTPFLLLYRVLGDTVEVARVVHATSDWKPRS